MFGGSAVPYHPSVAEMHVDDGAHELFSAGYNGPFYYGVHLTDTVRRICGSDWARAEPASHRASVTVTFEDDSTATLRFDGPTENAAFGLLDVGNTVRTVHINGDETELERMYEPFIDAFVGIIRGDRDPPGWLFDAARLLLAVQAVLETDRTIHPDSQVLFEVSKDGGAFSDSYRPLF